MKQISFAVVGSGWRSRFFLRIAAYYNDKYRVTGLLCRSKEKADAFSKEYNIPATTDEKDIITSNPDFIVVAVSRPAVKEVSDYWRSKGYTVLCETPAGNTREDLTDIYNTQADKGPLVVAEQYRYYPIYKSIIDTVKEGKIGEPLTAYVSLAHEYHGASLLRLFLSESCGTPYKMQVKKYDLPVTKTGDRFNIYTDGEILKKSKVIAHIEFADGKIATYDFESEQYHSLIRHNMVKITGTRGEIINEKLWYLDKENVGHEELLFNNLQSIRWDPDSKEISEDEIAIETLMENTYKVSKKDETALEWQQDNLLNALADAYFTILLQEANDECIVVDSFPFMQ